MYLYHTKYIITCARGSKTGVRKREGGREKEEKIGLALDYILAIL